MDSNEKIVIPLSKGKLVIILVLSVIFIGFGFWFIIAPPKLQFSVFDMPTLFWVSGVSSILFFGFCGVVVVKKLIDKRPGLIIDKTGIEDNSSGVSAGHIPWDDISEIKIAKVMSQKFLIIIVKNPEKYIKQQTKTALRKAVEYNYKFYGSPISIPETALKIKFTDLENIVRDQFRKYKS